MFSAEQVRQLLAGFAPAAITAHMIAAAALIFLGSVLAAWALRRAVRSLRGRAAAAANPTLYIVERLSAYVIIFIGLLVAISSLGVNVTSISLLLGAIGVGIGLGLQDTVKNFMAGLSLLMDRSIEVGDFIELETGVAGEIRGVGPRVTHVLTNDNVSVLVPNNHLAQNILTNWTRQGGTRRIHIPFKAPYGVDKELVRRAGLRAAASVPFTLPDEGDRRTQVWLVGFSEAGYYEFELVVWPRREAVKRPAAMHAAYTWAIDDALRAVGVEPPPPQLALRAHSLFGLEEDEALAAIGSPGHVGRHAFNPSRNDAAEDTHAAVRSEGIDFTTESKPGAPLATSPRQGPSTT